MEAVGASGWTVVRKLSGGTEAVCVEMELLWGAVDPWLKTVVRAASVACVAWVDTGPLGNVVDSSLGDVG